MQSKHVKYKDFTTKKGDKDFHEKGKDVKHVCLTDNL